MASRTVGVDKTIKLSDTVYDELSDYRDEKEHTSFDSAVRELLMRVNEDD